jgi:hypothetical protein
MGTIESIKFSSKPTAKEAENLIFLTLEATKSHFATYRSIQSACKRLFMLDPNFKPRLNSTTDELLDFVDSCLAGLRRIRDERSLQQIGASTISTID